MSVKQYKSSVQALILLLTYSKTSKLSKAATRSVDLNIRYYRTVASKRGQGT